MEPQLPTPSHSPEKGPAQFSGGEVFGGKNSPEKTQEKAPSQETREVHQGGPQGDPVAQQPSTTPPPLPVIDPAQTATAQPVDDTPLVAADDDLIEKEWVEKAKKVVNMTQHDPYMQEKAVSQLQADYLQKRYGKSVKQPSDG